MAGTGFELTHSADGISFSNMATVAGKGGHANYTVYDEHPFAGITYYRLKITEAGGHSTYCTIAVVKSNDNIGMITIAPVPADGTVIITSTDLSSNGKLQ